MGRGKIAVQCSHAAVSAAEEAREKYPDWYETWRAEGQAKIALKVKEASFLLELERKAHALRIPAFLVRDSGLTQVPPGTITCLGIGPAPSGTLDTLTRRLPLL